MNEKLLEEIGLTKGEIKVYLTLLRIGETTTGKIIENAEISSGKIYEILDKLIRKGLVSYIIKGKTKYFIASSPNRILDYMKEKEKELKKKEVELKKELPFLVSIQKDGKRDHETTLFKGIKGMQTAIIEALDEMNSSDEVLVMGVKSDKAEKYNILWEKLHQVRIRKKISCKILFSDKGTTYYKALRKMKLLKIRVLDGITPSSMDVMGDRVLIMTYGDEPSCLSINNSEIAGSFKMFFETMWNIAKG